MEEIVQENRTRKTYSEINFIKNKTENGEDEEEIEKN